MKNMDKSKQNTIELDVNELVMEIDDQLIEKGYAPFQRPLQACAEISKRYNLQFVLAKDHKDELVEAVHMVYRSLYRPEDLHMPPMHIGVLMFRDVFLPLKIPVIYGEVNIDPVKSLHNAPENTLKWIFYEDHTAKTFIDQWIDLFDFVYGLDDISKSNQENDQGIEFWQLAKQQLEGAAATLLGSIDKYTVIQNSVLTMELLLKGVMFKGGVSEREIKNFGHNMCKLSIEACKHMPKADHDAIKFVIERSPLLVERRYQAKNYSRVELGQVMMDAQFLAGEVLRQFSDRNVRETLTTDSDRDHQKRYYPNQ